MAGGVRGGRDHPGLAARTRPPLNPASALASRIGYIFSRGGGLMAGDAEVVGGEQGDRSTPSGFWPSDHTGLPLPAASQQRPVTIAVLMSLARAMALDTVAYARPECGGWRARSAARGNRRPGALRAGSAGSGESTCGIGKGPRSRRRHSPDRFGRGEERVRRRNPPQVRAPAEDRIVQGPRRARRAAAGMLVQSTTGRSHRRSDSPISVGVSALVVSVLPLRR